MSADSDDMEPGVKLINDERNRQIDRLGFSLQHDDIHNQNELAWAAVAYALPDDEKDSAGEWPFERKAFNKDKKSRVAQLIVAGAFIAAEIDRILRINDGKDVK